MFYSDSFLKLNLPIQKKKTYFFP